ncbi:spore coat protein [Sinanaerobacter sp. ZZT-01]|uniref:spore coat protein n=1 Tax=Sinanaerobacter sp. ZZT-01 TaxID=3111540 RepID=UPI002D76C161|nr:spore coat protein [Sinanaerobacter sp. ZZT-01]WRR93287.1 spore coat protein [Sinanaerobacter sp. ZZT-01]
MSTLTQKETTLLQDEKKHEEICIEKYNKYASQASDPQLKALFKELESKEQEHLNTINQMLSGTVPTMNTDQQKPQMQAMSQAQNAMQQPTQSQSTMQSQVLAQSQSQPQGNASNTSQSDCYLCTDALSTEKFVSSTYNTAIFEFKDPNMRQVLNHIQKEEQEHGEQIYNYMAQNGMYN